MIRRSLLAALCPAAFATSGLAADWRVDAFFSQRVQATGNRSVDGAGALGDPALDAVTDLGFAIVAETPRAQITLAPGLRGLFSTAEAVDGSNLAPRFSGSFVVRDLRSSLTGGVSVVPSFVSFSGLEDAGLTDDGVPLDRFEETEEETVQIAGSARIGYAYELSPRDGVSLTATARTRNYLGNAGDLAETRSFGLSGSWRRAFTPRTSGALSSSFQQFYSEGGSETAQGTGVDESDGEDGRTVALTAGLSHQVNARLSGEFSLGPTYTWRSGESSAAELGLTGRLGASYRTAQTVYSASLAQTVDQDAEGEIANQISASASAAHPINETSRLSLAAAWAFDNPLFASGENTDGSVLSLAPSYAVELTPEWSANLGYRFTAEVGAADDAFQSANSVFVQISRNISILP